MKGHFLSVQEFQSITMSWSSLPGAELSFPQAIATELKIELVATLDGDTTVRVEHQGFDSTESFEDKQAGWSKIIGTFVNPV